VAIVKTFHFPELKSTVYICDDAYINKTEEELEKVREEAVRVAYDIVLKAHLRGEI
jgi:hypothetical protein